ncbi:MAG: 3-hydroxyacyl-[acyl-carrier-protein] dehydratase FabZ, partial [Pseudomonadota bacterium]
MTHNFPIERDIVSQLLPHDAPALLVDRVLSFDGERVHAQVHISPDWDVFRGHFPDRPILPGVLMIEMVAQTGALRGVLGKMVDDDAFLAFTGIDKARFRRP